MRLALIFLLVLFMPGILWAEKPNYNQVQLSAEASREVANDTLVAVLYARREGHDPAQLADEVNRDTGWAVETAKAIPGVQVQTLSYNTSPKYDKGHLIGWRAEQSVQLKGTDVPALSQLIGTLQSRLAVQSVGYQVSDEVRKAAENELTTAALGNFQRKAQLIAGALGRKSYRIVHININGNMPPGPRPYIRSMAMEAKATAPTFEVGSQELGITVSGTVEISED